MLAYIFDIIAVLVVYFAVLHAFLVLFLEYVSSFLISIAPFPPCVGDDTQIFF